MEQPRDPSNAIEFEHVSKTYRIRVRSTPGIGSWVIDKALEHLRSESFDALNDVDVSIRKGELIGIVGDNGAGKSTVLKLMAGITEPTSGKVRVGGRIASLLELGVGFHPDLSGMENIFHNGTLMGLTRDEILARLEAIIDFSGLREFIYDRVRQYSTGMYMRLACSVALHLDPDIILVDEILAVGDAEFQERGMLRLLELHARGATMVLVTHELTTARYLCDRLVWIEKGRVRADGPSEQVHREYVRGIAARTLRAASPFREDARAATAQIVIGEFAHEGSSTTPWTVRRGERARFRLAFDAVPAGTRAAIMIRYEDGRTLLEAASEPLAAGATEAHYVIEEWEFGGFRGDIAMALIDASEANVARTPRTVLVSEAPGIGKPEFLLLPRAEVVVQRVGDAEE